MEIEARQGGTEGMKVPEGAETPGGVKRLARALVTPRRVMSVSPQPVPEGDSDHDCSQGLSDPHPYIIYRNVDS